jgi:hypothetical protein
MFWNNFSEFKVNLVKKLCEENSSLSEKLFFQLKYFWKTFEINLFVTKNWNKI